MKDTAGAAPPLHILKLCVGAESVEDQAAWVRTRLAQRRVAGEPVEMTHVTRMYPRRESEIVPGGSLYWVIKGLVLARQSILALRPVTGEDGVSRCAIVLAPDLVRTSPQPRRAFQGWRYFAHADAPPDLDALGEGEADLPPELGAELRAMGVLPVS